MAPNPKRNIEFDLGPMLSEDEEEDSEGAEENSDEEEQEVYQVLQVPQEYHQSNIRVPIPRGMSPLVSEMIFEVVRFQPEEIFQFLAIYTQQRLLKRINIREEQKNWDWNNLTEKEFMEFLAYLHLQFEEANEYAIIIQSAYRGHKVRKSKEGQAVKEVVAKVRSNRPPEKNRLPRNAIPSHYAIQIRPKFDNFIFEGIEYILLLFVQESAEIVLNSLDLTICNVFLKDSAEEILNPQEIVEDLGTETLVLKFDPPVRPGRAILFISYFGVMKNDSGGLYIARRQVKNSETGESSEEFVAVTQFEPSLARKAFPCWDEPDRKAHFSISLVVEKDKVSASNMPLKQIRAYGDEKNLELREYNTTPKMSSYLVAFMIGDFDFVDSSCSSLGDRKIDLRVYTPPKMSELGNFALDITSKILPFFQTYFGISYPLPKLDLVAVSEMNCSAMENFGLMIFKDSVILIDENQSSQHSRQMVAITVTHEICHQFFGNLVTQNWWNDLWLKEGFATYFEIFGTNAVMPNLDLWSQFLSEILFPALELDALSYSHPLEVEVESPSEIDTIFDDISYNKGGSLIRMLHIFIGNDAFRLGMQIYLARNAYSNASTRDLWQALEEGTEGSHPVGKIMDTWTKQTGFPLVRVRSVEQNDKGYRILQLSQERFCASPNEKCKGTKWKIPLTFSSQSRPTDIIAEFLMEDETATVELPEIKEEDWVKLNPLQIGYYRVQYPPEVLVSFMPSIVQQTLPPTDRMSLLNDLFTLVKVGECSTSDLLQFLLAYQTETNYNVWVTISGIIGHLSILLECFPNMAFKPYVRHLVEQIGDRVGWENRHKEVEESPLDKYLRSLALSLLISSGDVKTRDEARRRMSLRLNEGTLIDPDLRSLVFTASLSFPPEELSKGEMLDKMILLYMDSDSSEIKEAIGSSLGAVDDVELLQKVVEFSTSHKVLIEDTLLILSSVASNSAPGRKLVWEFIKDNWDMLLDKYSGGGLNMVSKLLKSVIENFISMEDANDVEAFFDKNRISGLERVFFQATEQIQINANWLERDKEKISEFLDSFMQKLVIN